MQRPLSGPLQQARKSGTAGCDHWHSSLSPAVFSWCGRAALAVVVTATVASLWLFSAGKEGQHWQQYLSRGSLLLFHRWACTGGVSSVTLFIHAVMTTLQSRCQLSCSVTPSQLLGGLLKIPQLPPFLIPVHFKVNKNRASFIVY